MQLKFTKRLPSVSFRLSVDDAKRVETYGEWELEFRDVDSDEVASATTVETHDGLRFEATFNDVSLAGRSGELKMQWTPLRPSLDEDERPILPLLASLSATFPTLKERLALGEIRFNKATSDFKGRVLDSRGSPVAGASIHLLKWKSAHGVEGWFRDRSQFIRTTKSGAFPPPTLPGEGRFALQATRGTEFASLPLPWGTDDQRVELVLGRASTVLGKLELQNCEKAQLLRVRSVNPNDGSQCIVFASVKEDGMFELRSLTGDQVDLEVIDASSKSAMARLSRILSLIHI